MNDFIITGGEMENSAREKELHTIEDELLIDDLEMSRDIEALEEMIDSSMLTENT